MNTENQTKRSKFNLKKILVILVIAIALITGIIVYFSIQNMSDVNDSFIEQMTSKNEFTLASGLNFNETAAALEEAGFVTKDEFIEAASNIDTTEFDFINNNIAGPEKFDGFLYPGKYKFDESADATMIIITMLNEFDNNFNQQFRDRTDELGMSISDIVTIASIIEKTATKDKDMPEISAVIQNRLNLGLEFEGGYPSTPICSPSIKAIKAALYPNESENTEWDLNVGAAQE